MTPVNLLKYYIFITLFFIVPRSFAQIIIDPSFSPSPSADLSLPTSPSEPPPSPSPEFISTTWVPLDVPDPTPSPSTLPPESLPTSQPLDIFPGLDPTPSPTPEPTPSSTSSSLPPPPPLSSSPQPSQRPHIVVMLADDLGWGNIGYHSTKQSGTVTPVIDQLASEGVKLERHYAHFACVPSRSSFESGRLPVHVTTANPKPSDPDAGLPLKMTGLGEQMRKAGYATHWIGKWDLGMATPANIPVRRGYSTSLHYFGHFNGFWDHRASVNMNCNFKLIDLWENNGPADPKQYNNVYDDIIFRQRAKDIILNHNNTDEPLFLFYSSRIAHTKYGVPRGNFFSLGDNDQFDCCGAGSAGGRPPNTQKPTSNPTTTTTPTSTSDTPTSPSDTPTSPSDTPTPLESEVIPTEEEDIEEDEEPNGQDEIDPNWIENITIKARTTKTTKLPMCGCRSMVASLVKFLDDSVGVVTDALKKKGLWNNTLFLFTADNGGPITPNAGANNYPLRGGKYSVFEGGIRTSTFVSGGFLPETVRGTSQYEMMHIADWYTTFTKLAGGIPSDPRARKAGLHPVDGLDMWPLISGKVTTSPRNEIVVASNVLIHGDYKFITGGNVKRAGWQAPIFPSSTPYPFYDEKLDCTEGCLFDVANDVQETINLAKKKPLLANILKKRLTKVSVKRHPQSASGGLGGRSNANYFPYLNNAENVCKMARRFYNNTMGPYRNIDTQFLREMNAIDRNTQKPPKKKKNNK